MALYQRANFTLRYLGPKIHLGLRFSFAAYARHQRASLPKTPLTLEHTVHPLTRHLVTRRMGIMAQRVRFSRSPSKVDVSPAQYAAPSSPFFYIHCFLTFGLHSSIFSFYAYPFPYSYNVYICPIIFACLVIGEHISL